MAKHHLQASYKPTKADLKFQRQEYREGNHTRCFLPQKGPGMVCTTLHLNQSNETAHPKYRMAYDGKPEDFFNDAIAAVSDICNATLAEQSPVNCTTRETYAVDYSLETSSGTQDRHSLYRDYELRVELNDCQGPQQIARNSELLKCSQNVLNTAAERSAESIAPYGIPVWGLALLGGGCVAAIAACYYCCRSPKPTAETRERQAQLREPMLATPVAQGIQTQQTASQPMQGQAPRFL